MSAPYKSLFDWTNRGITVTLYGPVTYTGYRERLVWAELSDGVWTAYKTRSDHRQVLLGSMKPGPETTATDIETWLGGLVDLP